MKTSKIKVGDIFTRLTIIKQLPKDEYDTRSVKRTLFECKCSCGNTKIIDAGNLKKGIKSCGCLVKELAREKGRAQKTTHSHLNSFYGDCKRSAKNRGLSFNLPKEYYFKLVQSNCYYCNTPPKIRDWKSRIGIPVPINGVDRIDNDRGYEEDNTVACCGTCNTMKMALNQEQFFEQCLKIVKNNLPLIFRGL